MPHPETSEHTAFLSPHTAIFSPLGHWPVKGCHDNLKGILADLIDDLARSKGKISCNFGRFISADYGSFRNIIGGGKKTTTGEQEAYNADACKQKNPFKKTTLLSMEKN
jgi:hypothetical protein